MTTYRVSILEYDIPKNSKKGHFSEIPFKYVLEVRHVNLAYDCHIPGADLGFEVGGFESANAEGGRYKGGPGACPTGKFLILSPRKCVFQRFEGQFEVV